MKVLIVLFICASLVDASLTIVGLHLGWHEEGNALINAMIEFSGSITVGVIFTKLLLCTISIGGLHYLYTTKYKYVSMLILVAATVLTMSAGLLWLT